MLGSTNSDRASSIPNTATDFGCFPLITAPNSFGDCYTNFYTSKREINLKLREKKVEVYSRFIEGWIKAFLKLAIKIKNGENNCQDAASTELQEFSDLLLDITDDLILWSSDDVLKKYCEFRENLPGEQSSEFEKQLGFIKFCKFMLDIRKDLGHLNKGIDEYDLLSLFLETKAIDEYRKLKPDIDKFLLLKKKKLESI